MSLGGTHIDHYKNIYKGLIGHECQQSESRLSVIPMTERMDGNKTFIDIFGADSTYTKTYRNQPKTYTQSTYERRLVQETFESFDRVLDKEDLIKYVEDPRNAIVKSAAMAMARHRDSVIMDAISGSATVITNDSSASQALTLSVAVNDHQFDSDSGDVGLTPSKLKLGQTLLQENYGWDGNSRLFCVAPARQIANLTTKAEVVSKDYRNTAPLEGPGVHAGLSGYLGITFIAYEDTGLSGTDELAFLVTDDAITLGVYQDIKVEYAPDTTLVGNPDTISVTQALGATRRFEKKVVKIICDPLA